MRIASVITATFWRASDRSRKPYPPRLQNSGWVLTSMNAIQTLDQRAAPIGALSRPKGHRAGRGKRARAGWPRPNWSRILPLLACVAFWTGAGLLVDRSAHAGQVSFDAPPVRYRADTSVKVLTKSADDDFGLLPRLGRPTPRRGGLLHPGAEPHRRRQPVRRSGRGLHRAAVVP